MLKDTFKLVDYLTLYHEEKHFHIVLRRFDHRVTAGLSKVGVDCFQEGPKLQNWIFMQTNRPTPGILFQSFIAILSHFPHF